MSRYAYKNEALQNVLKVLFNQREAGCYLGHSGEWLRQNALRHPLYRPSNGATRQGVPAKYHIDHLNIICQMMNSNIITEDDAYRIWQERKAMDVYELTSFGRKERKKRST